MVISGPPKMYQDTVTNFNLCEKASECWLISTEIFTLGRVGVVPALNSRNFYTLLYLRSKSRSQFTATLVVLGQASYP